MYLCAYVYNSLVNPLEWFFRHGKLDRNPGPGYNIILLRLIP